DSTRPRGHRGRTWLRVEHVQAAGGEYNTVHAALPGGARADQPDGRRFRGQRAEDRRGDRAGPRARLPSGRIPRAGRSRLSTRGSPLQTGVHRGEPARARRGRARLARAHRRRRLRGKARFREQMVATRAADDIVCVAYVNMVGGQDELVFDGASLIVNERGEVVARGRQFEEDFVVADLDLEAVFRARLRDSRRRKEKLRAAETAPRIVLPALPVAEPAPAVEPPPIAPLERVEEVYRALVLGTRDYVRKSGFTRVVIGLSGGIDSSLVAALAVEALGRENVAGAGMPSP